MNQALSACLTTSMQSTFYELCNADFVSFGLAIFFYNFVLFSVRIEYIQLLFQYTKKQ